MRKTLVAFCESVVRGNNDDVNGLSEKLLTDSQIPLLHTQLFYSLHTMRHTRGLLLHQIACQDLLLAQQEELLRKMYGQLHRTTNNYMQALENMYNKGGDINGER